MCACPTFKRAKILLQCIARRIRQPRILMPLVLPDLLLLVCRRQKDRHIHRSRQFIRSLTIVNGARRKSHLLILHSSSRNQKSQLKIPFDRYRSAESGITVTTLFPAPSSFASSTAAQTTAPALDPPNTPSSAASL